MKSKLILWSIVVLLMVHVAAAGVNVYEKAAVGRIVGDSPADMISSLTFDDLELKHATFYGDDVIIGGYKNEKENLLDGFMKDNVIEDFPTSTALDEINDDTGDWEENEFFLVDSESSSAVYSGKNFGDEFRDKKPFMVYSVPGNNYYGAEDSVVGKYSADSMVLTSSGYTDYEFTQALLCNLGHYSGKSVGELMRQTRNKFYRHAGSRQTGLSLMSYGLFGMPAAKYTVPEKYPGYFMDISYDDPRHPAQYANGFKANPTFCYTGTYLAVCDSYEWYTHVVEGNDCRNYVDFREFPNFGRYPEGNGPNKFFGTLDATVVQKLEEPGLGIQEANPQLTIDVKVNLSSFDVTNVYGFDIVDMDGTVQSHLDDSLVLPVKIVESEFPVQTVITDVRLVSLEDPVELTLSSLPMWADGDYLNRSCVLDKEEAGLSYSTVFTEDSELLITKIEPVEVIDCETGKVRIYTTVNYEIDYYVNSPIMIRSVDFNDPVAPGKDVDLTVFVENIKGESVQGTLKVLDGDKILAEKDISTDTLQHLITFKSPSRKGKYPYKLVFVQGGEEITEKTFELTVHDLSAYLMVDPINSGSVDVVFTNHYPGNLDVGLNYYLVKGSTLLESGNVELSLPSGSSTYGMEFDRLNREDRYYDVVVDIVYLDTKQTLRSVIVSNHKPVLTLVDSILVYETDKVTIQLNAEDEDNDLLTFEVNDSRFKYVSPGIFEWVTDVGDNGDYLIDVSVSDGVLVDSGVVNITVGRKLGDQLDFDYIEDKIVYPDETVSFNVDLRYDVNLVVNDTRFARSLNTFSWVPSEDDIGVHHVKVSTQKASETNSQTFNVIVRDKYLDLDLRSRHVAYVLNDKDRLKLNVKKRDMNAYDGGETFDVFVYDEDGNKVFNELIGDDGTSIKTGQAGPEQEVSYEIELEPGLYKIQFEPHSVGDDFIYHVGVDAKIMFDTQVLVNGPTTNTDLYFLVPDGFSLDGITWHDVLQNIDVYDSVGDEKGSLSIVENQVHAYKEFSVADDEIRSVWRLNIPKQDLTLKANKEMFFAVNEEEVFDVYRPNYHLPKLEIVDQVIVDEGLNAVIFFDVDEALNVTSSDSRFVLDDNKFVWSTWRGDAGIYNVKVGVSDGRFNVNKNVKVIVNEMPQSNLIKSVAYTDVLNEGESINVSLWFINKEAKQMGVSVTAKLFNGLNEVANYTTGYSVITPLYDLKTSRWKDDTEDDFKCEGRLKNCYKGMDENLDTTISGDNFDWGSNQPCDENGYVYETFSVPVGISDVNWTLKTSLRDTFECAIPKYNSNLGEVKLRTPILAKNSNSKCSSGDGMSYLAAFTWQEYDCPTQYHDGSKWTNLVGQVGQWSSSSKRDPIVGYYDGALSWKGPEMQLIKKSELSANKFKLIGRVVDVEDAGSCSGKVSNCESAFDEDRDTSMSGASSDWGSDAPCGENAYVYEEYNIPPDVVGAKWILLTNIMNMEGRWEDMERIPFNCEIPVLPSDGVIKLRTALPAKNTNFKCMTLGMPAFSYNTYYCPTDYYLDGQWKKTEGSFQAWNSYVGPQAMKNYYEGEMEWKKKEPLTVTNSNAADGSLAYDIAMAKGDEVVVYVDLLKDILVMSAYFDINERYVTSWNETLDELGLKIDGKIIKDEFFIKRKFADITTIHSITSDPGFPVDYVVEAKSPDLSTEINNYLETCIADSQGMCQVPISLVSNIKRNTKISNLDVKYASETNVEVPVETVYQFNFIWPVAEERGDYSITLIADYKEGYDIVKRNVTMENKAPVITEIKDVTVNEGELVTLVVIAKDMTEELEYSIDSSKFGGYGGVYAWQTGYSDSGMYEVKVTVGDGDLESTQIVKVTVIDSNAKPVLEVPKQIAINEGEEVIIPVDVLDPNGDEITLTVSDTRFKLDGSSFVWDSNVGEGGKCEVDLGIQSLNIPNYHEDSGDGSNFSGDFSALSGNKDCTWNGYDGCWRGSYCDNGACARPKVASSWRTKDPQWCGALQAWYYKDFFETKYGCKGDRCYFESPWDPDCDDGRCYRSDRLSSKTGTYKVVTAPAKGIPEFGFISWDKDKNTKDGYIYTQVGWQGIYWDAVDDQYVLSCCSNSDCSGGQVCVTSGGYKDFKCVDDPCATKTCDNKCDGNTRSYSGKCSSGDCSYTTEDCGTDGWSCNGDSKEYVDYGCGSDVCTSSVSQTVDCNVDNGWYCDGDISEYRDYGCSEGECDYLVTKDTDCNKDDSWVCDGNDRLYRDYGCSSGACKYLESNRETCDYGCELGYCKSDPCVSMPCLDYCDADTRYSSRGCNGGECGYQSQVCEFGCDGGKCNPDPCLGVTCGNKCNGDVRESSGTCVAGSCQYTENSCEFGCNDGDCKPDPCLTITCGDYCEGYTHYSSGSCSVGDCSYVVAEENSVACGYDPCVKDYYVIVTASDGVNEVSKTVRIKVKDINIAPIVDDLVDLNITEEEVATIKIDANDLDGDQLSYIIDDPNFVFENGEFKWKTSKGDEGEYNLTVLISDGELHVTKKVFVKVNSLELPPVMPEIKDIELDENEVAVLNVYAYSISEYDNLGVYGISDALDDSPLLNYSINDSRFKQFNNLFTWSTDYLDAGTYFVEITVIGENGLSSSQVVEVKVNNVNRELKLNDEPDIIVSEGQIVEIKVNATDPDTDDVLRYSIDETKFSQNDDVFSWQTKDGDAGVYVVEISATDGESTEKTEVFIKIRKTNNLPSINSVSSSSTSVGVATISSVNGNINVVNSNVLSTGITAMEGEYIEFNVAADDVDGDTLTYSIDNPEFEVSGSKFTWKAKAGDYVFSVIVSDGMNKTSKELRVGVLSKYCNTIKCESYCEGNTYFSAQCSDDVLFRTNSYGDYDPGEWLAINIEGSLQGYQYKQSVSADCDELTYLINTTDGKVIYEYDTNGVVLDLLGDCTLFYYEKDNDDAELGKSQLYSFTDSLREKVKGCSYRQYFSSPQCVTRDNKVPDVKELSNVTVGEGDKVEIIVNATDYENTPLSYRISDERFEQEGNVFTWFTDFKDNGVYKFVVTVVDAIAGVTNYEVEKEIYVTVNDVACGGVVCDNYCDGTTKYYNGQCNKETETCGYDMQYSSDQCGFVNNDPLISPIKLIVVDETEKVELIISTLEENVEIKIHDIRFEEVAGNYFTWQTGYDDAGSFEFEVIAKKGKRVDSKIANVAVINKNRAPKYVGGLVPVLDMYEDTSFSINLDSVFSDADGDSLIYSINDTRFEVTDSGVLSVQKDYWGVSHVHFVASDGFDDVISSDVLITVVNTPEIYLVNDVVEQYEYKADDEISFDFSINDTMAMSNCSLVVDEEVESKFGLNNYDNSKLSFDDGSAENNFRIGWYRSLLEKRFDDVQSVYGLELNVGYRASHPSDKEIDVKINDEKVYSITREQVESSCGRNKNCLVTVLFDEPVSVNGEAIVTLSAPYSFADHFRVGVDEDTNEGRSGNTKQGVIDGEYIIRLVTGSDVIRFKKQLDRGSYNWYGECYNVDNLYKKTDTYSLTVVNSVPTYPSSVLPESGTFSNSIDVECSGSYDGDNDPLTYTMWYKRGDIRLSEWEILEENGDGLATLDVSEMDGASLRLRCMANDGITNSPTKDVGWIKVEN
jgi:hypothetical protein